MNAVVLSHKGAPPVLKKIPVPVPGPDQFLVKVDFSPINPSDLIHMYGGGYGNVEYPVGAGNEGAGTIACKCELYGQRVSFMSYENPGAYAEYVVVNKKNVVPVHDKISLQQASCSFINPVTVIGMLDVVKKANVTAVVHTAAASQLGRMMVRHFQQNGVKVINVVRRQDQADILKQEGAEYILNQTDADFFEKLTALSTELKATICFECIAGEFTGQIFGVLPNKSTLYIYGCLSQQPIININIMDLFAKGSVVSSFSLFRWLKEVDDVKQVFENVQTIIGTSMKSEISKEFPIENFAEAVKFYSENMSLGKVLIRPSQEQ